MREQLISESTKYGLAMMVLVAALIVSGYTYTTVGADAKQYNTQAAADADCATLNNTYGAGRFIVGSHPKPH